MAKPLKSRAKQRRTCLPSLPSACSSVQSIRKEKTFPALHPRSKQHQSQTTPLHTQHGHEEARFSITCKKDEEPGRQTHGCDKRPTCTQSSRSKGPFMPTPTAHRERVGQKAAVKHSWRSQPSKAKRLWERPLVRALAAAQSQYLAPVEFEPTTKKLHVMLNEPIFNSSAKLLRLHPTYIWKNSVQQLAWYVDRMHKYAAHVERKNNAATLCLFRCFPSSSVSVSMQLNP